MKFTSLFLALTVTIAFSAKSNSQTHMSLQSSMQKLNKTPWGQVAASFLDLQMTVGSPIGDLIQAFQDFTRDNQFKMDINQKDHQVQLAEHNEWEAAIRERIAQAQTGIATATQALDNLHMPMKVQLEKQIDRDQQLDKDTVKDMKIADAERAESSQNHNEFVEECQTAIEAINDCLELLQGLGEGSTSLVQVTKVQRSFKKITASLKNTRHASMIKALLKLTDFANPDMLERLTNKFIAVRDSLLQDIENSRQEEEDQLANHQTFMTVSQETLDECRERVVENKEKHHENEQNITAMQKLREDSQDDLDAANADLDDELKRWANVDNLFQKMFQELQNERDAIDQVIEICSSIEVSAETEERMNQ